MVQVVEKVSELCSVMLWFDVVVVAVVVVEVVHCCGLFLLLSLWQLLPVSIIFVCCLRYLMLYLFFVDVDANAVVVFAAGWYCCCYLLCSSFLSVVVGDC